MKKSSWIKGAAVALGLAVGGLLYGQSTSPQSSEPMPTYRTNDGIFATPKTIPFSRDKDISLRQYLGDGKDAIFYELDPVIILNGKLNYLKENGPEVRKQYTPAARQREISYCESLLKVESAKVRDSEYIQSSRKLEEAVKDGIITAKEMEGIEGNVLYGVGEKSKTFDVPMLIYFTDNANAKPIGIEGLSVTKPKAAKQPLPLPEPPAYSPVQTTKKSNLELYFDVLAAPGILGITNDYNGSPELLNSKGGPGFVSAKVGLIGRINDWFELGGNLSGAIGFPEDVESIQTQPSPTGMYFAGSKTNENFFRIGAGMDFYFGDNFFFGLGPNVWIYGQKDLEQILDSNNKVIASNSNEVMKSTISGDFYLGIRRNEVGIIVGWDTRKGFYAGARIMIPLDKK